MFFISPVICGFSCTAIPTSVTKTWSRRAPYPSEINLDLSAVQRLFLQSPLHLRQRYGWKVQGIALGAHLGREKLLVRSTIVIVEKVRFDRRQIPSTQPLKPSNHVFEAAVHQQFGDAGRVRERQDYCGKFRQIIRIDHLTGIDLGDIAGHGRLDEARA